MGEPKSVVIQGSTARAVASGRLDSPIRHRTVKDAMQAERELGRVNDPNEQHVCPLCNEWLPWEAFKAHAPQCIQARVPRHKLWSAAGGLPVVPEHRKFGEI